jgi:phosphonate transport system substrate-binding protein
MRPLFSLILTGLLLALLGCTDNSEQSYAPVFTEHKTSIKHYQFAIHPLHNPMHLYEVFNPLMAYFNQHIKGVEFSLEASKNYASFNEKLKNQSVAFALPNPYQTLLAIDKGYKVIAKMGDDENFRGIFWYVKTVI